MMNDKKEHPNGRSLLISSPSIFDKSVSVFAGATVTTPSDTVYITEMLRRIQSGVYRNEILQLRKLLDRDIAKNKLDKNNQLETPLYDKGKKRLPGVCWAGTFTYRNNQSLQESSGFLCADLDHLADPQDVKARLSQDKYVSAVFVSPSRQGLKILLQIPFVTSDLEYKHVWSHVQRYFQETYRLSIDESRKDLSGLCFISDDPDMFINESAVVFMVTNESSHSPSLPSRQSNDNGHGKLILTWLEQDKNAAKTLICQSIKGNRHNNRLKAAKLLGGTYSGYARDYFCREEAYQFLESYVRLHTENFENAMKTINDGLTYGEQCPFSYTERHTNRQKWLDQYFSNNNPEPEDHHKKTPVTVMQIEQEAQRLVEKKFKTIKEVPFDLTEHHPFLQNYVQEAQTCTDAKPQTLITPLLSALAANVGNKAYIQCGHRKHFCNIWSIIIAPSTIGRKSTAIDIATAPLKDFNEELQKEYDHHKAIYKAYSEEEKARTPEPVRHYIKYPAASAEKFIEILSNNPNGIVIFYEIATFLSRMNKSYNADVKSTITAMFDGSPFEASTLSRGDQYVRNPAFSIATASTKEWFLKEIDRENDTNSGFLQRFLICNSHDVNFDSLRFDFREEETVNQFLKNKLAYHYAGLREIGKETPRAILLSKEAKQLYEHEQRNTLKPYFMDNQTALYSYIGRLFEDYFFRFSMLFTLIDHISSEAKTEDLIVSAKNAKYAHALCHFYLKNIEYFLQNELADNWETRNEKTIMRILKEKGEWVRHTTLKDLSNLNKKRFDEAILRLWDQGIISVEKRIAKNNRETPYYRSLLKK